MQEPLCTSLYFLAIFLAVSAVVVAVSVVVVAAAVNTLHSPPIPCGPLVHSHLFLVIPRNPGAFLLHS